jgi:hypothetical protein
MLMPMDMSWHDYNKALIERGKMILVSHSSTPRELEEMNRGK